MQAQSSPKLKATNGVSQLQSAMLVRASVYGAACSLYFAITLIYTQCINEPDRGIAETLLKSAEDVSYWLPGFLLLIPVAAHDLMKLSSQVAKPITDLRREFSMLVAGQSERPLSTSEGDYWHELTQAYNQVRGELLQLRKRLGEVEAQQANNPVIEFDDFLTVSETSEHDIEDTVKLEAPPGMPVTSHVSTANANLTV